MNNDMIYNNTAIIKKIDKQRELNKFLTIIELLKLCESGNIILDPMSTLISNKILIGTGNIFYPNILMIIKNGGVIEIGDNNTFFPQTYFLADPGKIEIGNFNQFGDGGLSIKANYSKNNISIASHGRYLNGVQIIGTTYLGAGSQIIGGLLTVQDCYLGDGESFSYSEIDNRGGVLKGFGLARNLKVEKGKVINGQGYFDQTMIQNQSFYHPKK